MTTSHRAGGPGGFLAPGPDALRACFANDNDAGLAFPGRIACGLVLSTEFAAGGAPCVAIRLLGTDKTLSQVIVVTEDASDIIADWRGLGRDLDLPLYLRDASGVMTPVTPLAGEIVHARRKGSPLSGRRPRFLTRRKVPANPVPAGSAKVVRKG